MLIADAMSQTGEKMISCGQKYRIKTCLSLSLHTNDLRTPPYSALRHVIAARLARARSISVTAEACHGGFITDMKTCLEKLCMKINRSKLRHPPCFPSIHATPLRIRWSIEFELLRIIVCINKALTFNTCVASPGLVKHELQRLCRTYQQGREALQRL